MIKGYPEGSNITILNTIYNRPHKDSDGKKIPDNITIVFIDNDTGMKHKQTIVNPPYEFYMAKEDVPVNHNLFFIEKDKVDLVVAPYADVTKKIAELTDNMKYYSDNIKDGRYYENRKLHTVPRVFRSDMNVCDFYRYKFSRLYQNNIPKLTKAYFDIETDIDQSLGDIPEPGECPINAISLILENTHVIYSFILRDEKNPSMVMFENGVNQGRHREELYSFIGKTIGKQNYKKMGLDDIHIQYLFYDEEIDLITDLFTVINLERPDFIMAWNIAFDIPYIIERIIRLGYNPNDIMMHPDFKDYGNVNCFIDNRAMVPSEKCDDISIPSYSVYVDQLVQFASRRKGQSAFPSFKLDDIGNIIAKVHKLDYSHITTNLAKLPKLDFKTFIYYNIMDTMVQWCIESWTEDIEYLFSKCISNNTRYSKCHRQTIYLSNRAVIEFEDQGFIIGNNINKWNEKPTDKFPGAFVAEPLLVSDYAKAKIDGHPVNIYDNLDDFDYARLYPSEIMEHNMAPNTQIAKVHINDTVWKDENRFHNKYFNRGGFYLEDMATGCFIEFAHRWHHFPKFEELHDDIIEFYTHIEEPCEPINNIDMVTGLQYPFYKKAGLEHPFKFMDRLERPFEYIRPLDFNRISEYTYNGASEIIKMPYQILILIFNYMKMMKCGIAIIFEDGYIYGLEDEDNFTSVVYRMKTDIIGYNFMCTINLLNDFIKMITPSKDPGYIDTVNILINTSDNTIICEGLSENVFPLYKGLLSMVYIFDIIKYINAKCIETPTLSVENIRDNVEFENILLNKSKDGAIPFIIDKYFMHIVPSSLLINKADNVSLDIFNECNNRFIAKFNIKKKNVVIDIFIKYVNLI